VKLRLSEKEIVLLLIAIVVIIGLGVYAYKLHGALSAERQVNEANAALLRTSDAKAHENDNYIDTICAEYRKLYESDRVLRYPNHTNVDKYIGLPGSASGQIDKCYLPAK
jgi:uncharacterized membrane protein affecting hemolysin expression